ncbi:pimeloyl-ACP methyl ester carboxylesterase [Pseudonocardia hierapolitana]|uniref:Pimeloyl-ACP methyl ester carboxylesterase n=1 Tax=Pseudonocardia hierapolitana TaxID=1128676 RepID=A0A561SSP7_9PSEU|nr:alpha/beta hydrolase [Pseudonocardia hierapolitana]TWF77890.1 pimeloyl-ACP methyl ester carboxylesterase [Pseudonocardia hierapolitana]
MGTGRRAVRASDGLELAVTEFGGAGTPILLLHGLMGRASTWWAVAEWLACRGRVVGVDARGHGRSGARGPWTTDRMVADVVDVLTELGPAVVIGHSMGGLHGLVAAARRPELVCALVVEDMGVDFRGRSAADARAWFTALPQPFPSLAAVRRAFGYPRPEFGEYMTECVEERADGYHLLARVDHTTAIAAEWAERDHWAAVASVRCPALLVEAEESVAPSGQMALMAARMDEATHVRVPGTGHLVHAGPGFQPLIESFLSTHM